MTSLKEMSSEWKMAICQDLAERHLFSGSRKRDFVCEQCGKVEDLDHADMEKVKDLFRGSCDHRILRLNVVMEGRCGDCLKAALS